MQRIDEIKQAANANTDDTIEPIKKAESGIYKQSARVKLRTVAEVTGSEAIAVGTAEVEKEVHGGKPTKVSISNIVLQKDSSASSSLFKYSEITGSATVDHIQDGEEQADIKAEITLGKAEGLAYYAMPTSMTQSVEEKHVPFHASDSQRKVKAKFSIYAPIVGAVTQEIEAETISTPRFTSIIK